MISANLTEPATARHSSASDSEAYLDRILAAADNPDWLIQRRRKALEMFHATPLPERSAHLWRYTDPNLFLPSEFTEDNSDGTPPGEPSESRPPFDRRLVSGVIHCWNGSVSSIDLDPDVVNAGVKIIGLNEAAREYPEIVRNHLGSLIGPGFGKFEALANAFWSGGLLVYVPKNVEVAKPVHVTNGSALNGSVHFQRHLVVVEENSSLTLVDEYGQGNGATEPKLRTHAIIELLAGAHARLNFVTIQNWGREAVSCATHRAQLGAGAKLETVMTSLGSRIAKIDCGAILSGTGAESNFFGLAVGTEQQHFDHHTVHDHQAGSTHSDLHFKIAVRDRANSVYTGLIRIDEGAQFCEAYQENRNLILSPKARAESIPELEIMNNEVRCTHGATVGKVNPEEIFYLQSRGINQADAIRLIVTGFVGPILDRIPEFTRERLHHAVLQRLGEE